MPKALSASLTEPGVVLVVIYDSIPLLDNLHAQGFGGQNLGNDNTVVRRRLVGNTFLSVSASNVSKLMHKRQCSDKCI